MSLILVYSPKGGVGVTTVAANLALSLARADIAVSSLDLDDQDTMKLHLGLQPHQMSASLSSEPDADAVLAGVRMVSNPDRSQPVAATIDWVRREMDRGVVVVADIPRTAPELGDALSQIATLSLCVLAADAASVAVLPRAVDMMAASNGGYLVVNRVDPRSHLNRDAVEFMARTCGSRLLGRIRRDEAVDQALAHLEPLNRHAPASAAGKDFQVIGDLVRGLLADRVTVPMTDAA